MVMVRRIGPVVPLVGLTLALAACGSDRESRDSTTAPRSDSRTPTVEPTPSGPTRSAIFTEADHRSFARLAARLPGREGVAVAGIGIGRRVEALGSLKGGVAWSTAKAPVVMAAMAGGSAVTPDIRQAITASDNAAAERVFAALGGGQTAAAAATAQLREAGDQRTVIEGKRLRDGFTSFGQTDWPLNQQARFAAGLACSPAGRQVLDLMGEVIREQRWGLAAVDRAARIKSGWGPGVTPGAAGGWLDRQMGILTVDGRDVAVTLATDAPDHAAGIDHITELAQWVARHASARALPKSAAC